MVVGLGKELFDQQRHHLALGSEVVLRQHALQHPAFTIDVGIERRLVDNDGGREQMAFEDTARREGERDAGGRRQFLLVHVGHMDTAEHQPHGLAEAAPF